MKVKKKDYLMANIQVVSFQKKLLKAADYEELLVLDEWSEIRAKLGNYTTTLPSDFPIIAEVDQFYRDELQLLREEMSKLSVDDEELSLLFVRKDAVVKVLEGALASPDQVDETVLAQYLEVAKNSPSELIQNFAKQQLDFYYLNRYLRMATPKLLNLKYAKGHLSAADWQLLYSLPKEKGVQWLAKSYYHRIFVETGTIGEYFWRMDQSNWQVLRSCRYQVRGIEGIFVYLYEKISELYNLRLLLKGKIYQLPKEEIRAKLRWLNV